MSGQRHSTSCSGRSRSSEIVTLRGARGRRRVRCGHRGAVVERWARELNVRHVWQPQEGFRKARLLNRAVLASSGDYLVFLDGDCVPTHGLDELDPTCRPAGMVCCEQASPPQRGVHQAGPRGRSACLEVVICRLGPPGTARARHVAADAIQPTRRAPSCPRPSRPGGPAPGTFNPRTWGTATRSVSGGRIRACEWVRHAAVRVGRGGCRHCAATARVGLRCGWPGPGASVLHLWHPRIGGSRSAYRAWTRSWPRMV